jgi:hypothetical protein
MVARLEPVIVLGKGSRVMITRNVWQGFMTQGLVEHSIERVSRRHRGSSGRRHHPSHDRFSALTAAGNGEERRTYLSQGTIPIVPIGPLKTFESQWQPMARTQLPLRLAWAVIMTVHKSQGLTLPRIRLELGTKEFSRGLTFVALSRVPSLNGLLYIEKLDCERVKTRKLGGKFLQLRLEYPTCEWTCLSPGQRAPAGFSCVHVMVTFLSLFLTPSALGHGRHRFSTEDPSLNGPCSNFPCGLMKRGTVS